MLFIFGTMYHFSEDKIRPRMTQIKQIYTDFSLIFPCKSVKSVQSVI
jgi:hypothetical protein